MNTLTKRIARASSAVCLIVAFGLPSLASATGPDVFTAQKCTECHSVKSASIKSAPDSTEKIQDLSKVGSEMDKKEIARFLLKKSERNGEKHKKSFQGTTDELKTLAEWLETLK